MPLAIVTVLLKSDRRISEAADICWEHVWLLKNSVFAPNDPKSGDRKCLSEPRTSIVGHRSAFLFW